MSQGVDITRYAWVRNADGYDLRSVGGPRIGCAVSFPPKCWCAYPVRPGSDKNESVGYFDTRADAGRWLVEQWEGQGEQR